MSEYKFYGIKDNWKDLDAENVVEVTSEDGSISDVKVNGVEYGGGGGGDFSTAQVTLVASGSVDLYIPVIGEFPIAAGLPPTLGDGLGYIAQYNEGTSILTVVLYKGRAFATEKPGTIITALSGSAEMVFGNVVITGDCTITAEET